MSKKFTYTKTYKYNNTHDDRNINKIIFDIDLDLNMKHAITFEAPVTTNYAINEAEKFLSGKLTKTYLKANPHIAEYWSRRGNADENYNWLDVYKIKGDLLQDHYFLQVLKIKDGVLTLVCGS